MSRIGLIIFEIIQIQREVLIMKFKGFYLFFVLGLAFLVQPGVTEEARLLRNPTVSQDHVAFVYANDIWVVPRDGG